MPHVASTAKCISYVVQTEREGSLTSGGAGSRRKLVNIYEAEKITAVPVSKETSAQKDARRRGAGLLEGATRTRSCFMCGTWWLSHRSRAGTSPPTAQASTIP